MVLPVAGCAAPTYSVTVAGAAGSSATGIDNDGQIAATGCKAGGCFALRLDPAP